MLMACGIPVSFICVEHSENNCIKWPKTPRVRVKIQRHGDDHLHDSLNPKGTQVARSHGLLLSGLKYARRLMAAVVIMPSFTTDCWDSCFFLSWACHVSQAWVISRNTVFQLDVRDCSKIRQITWLERHLLITT